MNSKRMLGACVFILLACLVCIASVTAADNNTYITAIDDNGELQVSNLGESVSNTIDDDELGSKNIGGFYYDQEVEIQVKNMTIQQIHYEKYVLDKKGNEISSSVDYEFPDKQIPIKVINLDYNKTNIYSIHYPANFKLTFSIYENGKFISNFTRYTDAYGYANFSSTMLPEKVGTYTIIVKHNYDDQNPDVFGYATGEKEYYYEYLDAENTFTVVKSAPEHNYRITSYWNGQKYTVYVKLTDDQYQLLKAAKKNKKSKSISGIPTKTYVTVKKITTKKLVTCKIIKNKKTGKFKKQWTKNWKSQYKKYIKQGYTAKKYKKNTKTSGKIWILFKKTIKKKYEIKAFVSTFAKNGQYKKGDYITLYGPEPMGGPRINIV